jgi:hypothetical protein
LPLSRPNDTSFHGNYGADHDDPPKADATIHDFVVDGELYGDDLTVTRVDVSVGACHALQSSGPVIRQARAVAGGDTDPTSTLT